MRIRKERKPTTHPLLKEGVSAYVHSVDSTKLLKFYDMTNFDKKLFAEWGKSTASVVIMVIMLLFACVMCGCKTTQYVPVETVRTEYREADTTSIYNRLLAIFESRKEKESQSDSLIDRMKETVVINEQGDTTRHDMEHIVYKATAREKELEVENKMLRDSISVLTARLESIKTDSASAPYPVEKIVEVEKNLTWWQSLRMNVGGIAIFLALIVGGLWVYRKFRK